MRHYLLPQGGHWYKANLHGHTTLSDGKYTPEQYKEVYKRYGYSVLSLTDHNVLIDHSDMNDDDMIFITGYEADINRYMEDTCWNHRPCVHLCFYALDPHNDRVPCFNPKYVWGDHQDLRDAQKYVGTPDYERSYSHVNDFICDTNKEGFICALNHPTWSIQDLDDLRHIEGCFAMEMYNHSCAVNAYDEFNTHMYDDLLRRGSKMFVLANDDNHDVKPEGHPMWDSCGGYTMINAESLTYENIMDALQKGNCYASNGGPEILELYVEGETVHVKTTPAAKIYLNTYGRRTSCATGSTVGELITEAELPMQGLYDRYIRITVTDGKGHYSWTHAYFDAAKMENGKYEGVPMRE